MSSDNRLAGLHDRVFNRQVVLNRVEFNHGSSWGNQPLVQEATRAIRGTVGPLQMSDAELQSADSILSMAYHSRAR
ncbi:MAG: hypothetical protein IPG45_25570 [Deltaproteobacteria bacterium]|nr:hypothetical protein [Deltaproteobacteria bacterium]